MRLDHVIIAVEDLDRATGTWETILGVPVAVRSDHPAYGTRNALYLFERGPYLELIAAPPGAASGGFVDAIQGFVRTRGEGLFGVALTPQEMDAAVVRLRECGFDVPEATHGAGVSGDGRVREWRGTRLPGAALHGAFSLLVEHEGWDWRAELRPDPYRARAGSAVTSLHHVVFDVPDAEAASRAWEERFGLRATERITSERMGALVIVHPAGAATIEAVSATAADGPVAERFRRRGEGMSSVAFEVRDLDSAIAAVRGAGLTIGEPAPGVLPNSRVARIGPASANGVAAQLLTFA